MIAACLIISVFVHLASCKYQDIYRKAINFAIHAA